MLSVLCRFDPFLFFSGESFRIPPCFFSLNWCRFDASWHDYPIIVGGSFCTSFPALFLESRWPGLNQFFTDRRWVYCKCPHHRPTPDRSRSLFQVIRSAIHDILGGICQVTNGADILPFAIKPGDKNRKTTFSHVAMQTWGKTLIWFKTVTTENWFGRSIAFAKILSFMFFTYPEISTFLVKWHDHPKQANNERLLCAYFYICMYECTYMHILL